MGRRASENLGHRAHQHERSTPTREPLTRPPPMPMDRSRPLPDAYLGELGRRPVAPRYSHVLEADRRISDAGLRRYQTDRRRRLAAISVVTFGLLMLALGALLALSAEAQRAPSEVEQLARIVVHETGWEDTGDASAIYAVLVAGGEREGTDWRAYARRYSRRLHRGEVRRRWAAELTEDCARPPSWPRVVTVRRDDGSLEVRPHPSWGAYQGRCQRVMARVREVLSGERVHHCERAPTDWGGECDLARAARLGFIEIDCSAGDLETRGHYYVRPSLAGDR